MPGPAFAALAAAIDRKVSPATAAQLLANYRAEIRREQSAELSTLLSAVSAARVIARHGAMPEETRRELNDALSTAF